MIPIGAHIGNEPPLRAAKARDADLIQMFLADPQSWEKPPDRDDAEELRISGLPIYVHAPYPMNPVAANNRIRIPSRKTLAQSAEAAEKIGAVALIVHGGHVADEEDVTVGFERWRKALDSYESTVPVLIENTAGGGNAVARELANYGPLWEIIGGYNVGVCLDTCHAWAAGQDLVTAVDTLRSLTGRLDLVHCNDSRDPLGSRRDRHANLDHGLIPGDLLVGTVRAASVPTIVETPGVEGQAADIAWLRGRLSEATPA